MNTKLLTLIALTLGAQSIFGMTVSLPDIDINKYLNIDRLNELTTKMPTFLQDNKDVMGAIYNTYQPKAIKLYEYITTTPWTVDTASNKIAEVASMVLQNDMANRMLQGAYQVDLAPYARLLKMAKGEVVGAAIENYARTKGFAEADAKMLKNGIQDLAEWVTAFYNSVYKNHIKGQLDALFANKDVNAIAAKIRALINDPEARGLVLSGINQIDNNWPYIVKKLGEYGFNAKAFEGFKNNVLDALININENINNPS